MKKTMTINSYNEIKNGYDYDNETMYNVISYFYEMNEEYNNENDEEMVKLLKSMKINNHELESMTNEYYLEN